MGRIYQDFSFNVVEVFNRSLLSLYGLVEEDSPDDMPIVMFACLSAPLEWHRFFLDAGAGFWEILPDLNIADEIEDSFRFVEYLPDRLPNIINQVYAFESLPTKSSRIVLKLKNGDLIQLACQKDIVDQPTCITFYLNDS